MNVRRECAVLGCGTAVPFVGTICGECQRKGEVAVVRVLEFDQAPGETLAKFGFDEVDMEAVQ